jgi:hypothetical protein
MLTPNDTLLLALRTHEAGHSVVAVLLGKTVELVSIDRPTYSGYTQISGVVGKQRELSIRLAGGAACRWRSLDPVEQIDLHEIESLCRWIGPKKTEQAQNVTLRLLLKYWPAVEEIAEMLKHKDTLMGTTIHSVIDSFRV